MHRPWLPLVFLSLPSLGCAEKPKPCFGIQKGDRFDIELVEVYDENSSFPGGWSGQRFSCGADWDFSIGDRVTIRVLDQRYDESRTCTGSIVTLEPDYPSRLEILQARTENIFPHGLFHGSLDVRVGQCQGGMTFQVWDRRPTDDLFVDAEPGKSPFFYLIREYAALTNCDAFPEGSCGENFVVNIHPHAD
jgi:hypothetical protein